MAGEQPKKPTGGAYGMWLAEHRAELQKEVGPGKPASEVAKLAGSRFKEVNAEEKAVYQKKFEEANAKYAADMEAFLEAGGEKKGTKRKADKTAKKKKDPAAPKKPAGGAFGCFLAKNRPAFMLEVKGQPITAVTKLASDRWKSLSEDEKKVFQEEYETKKAEYEEAKKSYVPLPSAENEAEKPAKKARVSKEDKETAKQSAKEKKAAEKQAKADTKAAAKDKAKAKAKASPKSKAGKGSGKGAKKAAAAKSTVELSDAVAAKADKAGLKAALLNLAARADVKESGKSHNAILKALEESGGLIHPAKRALLGA
ncbi:SSRP1 [Symbiodinium pilosum]|uniref:SSRP1 protein n=1 Tax=Symbiodinium pilosum TaxID=2952 RepID=A0A812IRJ1_SYMPI|nr:SSRP1 [Symbiodinium pilosum]